MVSRRFLKGLWILSCMVCFAGVTLPIWNGGDMLFPTPETESAFLRRYTPERVISSFKSNDPSSSSSYASSAAGRKSVSRKAGWECSFTMCSGKWMPLMDSLKEDVSGQLIADGAQILAQSGDRRVGFHFEYKAGHILGSLTILPLATSPHCDGNRATALQSGLVNVTARIEQAETWYPHDPRIIQVSVVKQTR